MSKFRVWHIPQVPGTPFRFYVRNVREAVRLLDALAKYDDFQLRHNIKPDYASAQGLETLEDGEWVEWCDDDGDEISSYTRGDKVTR